jgi:dTDP-4-amino-4,6-dideoxygalactose transaminase
VSDVRFADLPAQWREVRQEFLARLERIGEDAAFVLSPVVAEFEEAFAEYCESAFCVGTNSGTDALVIALVALGVGPGDEVIVPAQSFVASAAAVCHAGATPVFVDVDEATRCIDPKQVEARLSPRSRAILAVHLYGNPAPLDALARCAAAARLPVLEDACQAHGARLRGRRVGSLGTAAAFSFYPGKNLGGFGDGGALVTGDARLAEVARGLRNHGGSRRYEHLRLGYNSRLDAVQAAALLCKLPRLDGWNARRRAAAARYRELLGGIDWLRLPVDAPQSEPVHHLFPVEVIDPGRSRDRLLDWLDARGVRCGIHYPQPLHLLPPFARLGHGPGDFPVAERASARHLSLPMHASLAPAEVERVARELRAFPG